MKKLQSENHRSFSQLKSLMSCFILLIGVACMEDTANLKSLQKQTMNLEDLFEKVSRTKVQSGNVLYVEFTWNKIDNTAIIDFSEEREPDFFVLETIKSAGANLRGPSYTVECSNGSKSWTKTCDSNLSCGKLIKECLDQGGCATICKKTLVYLGDEYDTFYVY
ncbi:MAG: hypothetical protein N2044_02090 [Cyclobacteriaceae bacterium]|nr:hypothetical protein [Cyclobacteriaceae bacterium]MCX7636615.1 hypothetical protein [Cyclobacteriaceae bacterium]MDW8331849.1 hypothetical protein [Cyclobacteriaceae bacterium]